MSIWIGDRLRLLSLLLRIGGFATSAAFLAVFLPADWMATTHEALGLGPFPRAPIVDYLARSIALLYGFHGILMFIVAVDPVRYRPIVTYVAVMNLTFGIAIAFIDIHAGLPWYWILSESGAITVMGVLIALLNRSISSAALLRCADGFEDRRRDWRQLRHRRRDCRGAGPAGALGCARGTQGRRTAGGGRQV